jgi:uncharacterized Zn-binding protein involved in type VI secretion
MPAVTRIGDLDIPHCSPMVRAQGSGSVFVNGKPVSCQTHLNTLHLLPVGDICLVHVAPITSGSRSVKIEGLGCGRVGDGLTTCTSVAQGSTNVFAGG